MRKRLLIIAAALLLAFASPGGLFAQNSSEVPADPFAEGQDPFDSAAFDQAVQQGEGQDSKAALETQFGGNFVMNASAATTADFDWYTAAGSFSGKAFVKVSVPDYGSAYLAYNFSKNLSQGAGGTLPLGGGTASGDLFSASFALSEFYLGFDIAQAVFFRVGNQLLAWGPSFIWTPVDFVNLQRADPRASFDMRSGKPGVRATVPLGISNVFLFADLTGTVTPTGPGDSLEVNDPLDTVNLAARWDITLLGFELALTGYVGSSIQGTYGFDFSGRVLGFDVYGELAMAFPYGSYDFSYASSLGLQRSFGELSYWSVACEFFVNSTGTDDTASYPGLFVAGDFIPFYVGKYYGYSALTRTHIGIDGIDATLAGFVNFSDQSYLLRLSTNISVPRLVPFTFGVSWAGGGADKEFTYFSGNNSLTADLRVSFDF
jgi:hypothetical protein